MRVFVGMECSGTIRRAFRERGHDVVSCDLLPAEDDGIGHVVGDVFDVFGQFVANGWQPDLGIFHPDCTYLTNACAWAFKDPPYHQKVKPGTLVGEDRRRARDMAVATALRLINLPIHRICVENPRGHLSRVLGKPDQEIQPYKFGWDASKTTALWLRNLPRLRPTSWVEPRMGGLPLFGGDGGLPRWSNQTDSGQNKLSESAERWLDRARTYPGIALAMAEQWGI